MLVIDPRDDRSPVRRDWPETKPLPHNLKIVDALKKVAAAKGVTPAQLSLAWVSSLGPHLMPLPGSSYVDCIIIFFEYHCSHRDRKATRTLENMKGGSLTLTDEEKAEVDKVLAENEVKGGRYFDKIPQERLNLWG